MWFNYWNLKSFYKLKYHPLICLYFQSYFKQLIDLFSVPEMTLLGNVIEVRWIPSQKQFSKHENLSIVIVLSRNRLLMLQRVFFGMAFKQVNGVLRETSLNSPYVYKIFLFLSQTHVSCTTNPSMFINKETQSSLLF